MQKKKKKKKKKILNIFLKKKKKKKNLIRNICVKSMICIVIIEGVNGQLPNLDLINTIVAVATRTNPPIQITLHDDNKNPYEEYKYSEYLGSLNHMLSSMKYLVTGHPSSEAGLYLRYACFEYFRRRL
jgi:hypothetical protein